MYAQRPEGDADRGQFAFDRPWLPPAMQAAGEARHVDVPTGPSPWLYVVVDELIDEYCLLTVDLWPAMDRDGRLVFYRESSTADLRLPVEIVQALVTRARQGQRLEVADRRVRIGDVFAMQLPVLDQIRELAERLSRVAFVSSPAGYGDDLRQPLAATAATIVDVTADARDVTQAAAQEAAAGVLDDDDIEALGLRVEPPGSQPPPTASGDR